MRSLSFLETFWQDVHYGARLLLRNRTFAVVAILTLALGTGANTAIFQLVNAVRLRTLPVERPDDLVEVRIVKTPHGRTGSFLGSRPSLSNPLYERIRDDQRVFSSMMAWSSTRWNLAAGGEVRLAAGMYVSGSYFETLGVRAVLGRTIAASDDVKGCAAPVAVVSDAFWRREFGADPGAVGRAILLDGHRFDIVGVAPASFTGVEVGRRFDVALPICAEPMFRGANSGLARSDYWFLASFARLKAGVTIDQASAQLAAMSGGLFPALVSPRYDANTAKDFAQFKLGALPAATGVSGIRNAYGDPLNILLGVTAIVLVIACANLANLMLARATAREREIAVRLAIGASRRRIVRQMLSESLLLAAIGASGGLLVARWLSTFLVSFLGTEGSPVFVDLAPDWRVFGFSSAVALAACVLFGLAPAVRATRTAPGAAMKSGSRTMTEGRERFGMRRALVVIQVALSLVLVVGALLFVRTLRNLTRMDPGFRQDGVLVANLDYRKAGIEGALIPSTDRRVVERLRAIPGVDGVSQVTTTPVGGNFWNDRIILGGQEQDGNVNFNRVGPGYFDTLATRLVAGRDFSDRDSLQSPRVAVVTESFVRKYLPAGQAVGQSFQVAAPIGEARPMIQIVGVARDVKYTDLREPFTPIVYVAMSQSEEPDDRPAFALHAATALPAVTAAATRALAEINPAIAVQYQTVRAQVEGSLLRERLMAALSGFFGGLAVLIATVGLYGVMAYTVVRRRVEIGIRMALGATRAIVIRMIVREATVLLLAGIIVGAALSVLAARSATALLYDLRPWDPATLLLGAAALGGVTIAASCIPALRASRLEPTRALREE
ncbi:MAG TPA: ABC transporter permease [Vicinamibacterales bacterium]|nr:ABC transporter permease [Vicinamibacterales bacterium]